MKIIIIGYAGSIESVVLVNDDEEQETLNVLNAENDKLEDDMQCYIKSMDPDSLEDAINYLRS